MTRFEVGIPLGDVNGSVVITTSLQETMETLASDGISHNSGQDTRYQAGNELDQCRLLWWSIQDTALATAQSNYNTFIAGFTFTHSPYVHSYTIA